GKDEEALTAYDAKSGKQLWQKTYPRAKFFSIFGTGPQATPAVAGGRVFTHGITGILSCFDAEEGDLLWQVDTQKELGAAKLVFGRACSPLVDEDRVLLNVGAKGASVVAFSADKGAVVWKALDDPPSYSSGVVLGTGKDRQLVFLTGQAVRALE